MNLSSFPSYVALKTIRIYQKTLSFDHGVFRYLYPDGFCRFHPTCSEYGYQAIERFGLFKGGWLATKRIVRCNPYANVGLDPVPPKENKK
ncbi:MAG: membrane protein insertion efficiency factor YidD [Patescibacteria group bacterium]